VSSDIIHRSRLLQLTAGFTSGIPTKCLDKVFYRIILFKCVHEFIQITKLKIHVICTQLRISVF
jgi:hypothetical protein